MKFALVLILGFIILASPALAQSEPPFLLPKQSELNKLKSAIIYTEKGRIYCELFPESAPWHVANFKYLADKGYYKGALFDAFYDGYIIQGGSRPGSKLNYSLPPEFSDRPHELGTLGMARRPDGTNLERRSSANQFHILLADAPHMDHNYTIFGKVVSGMDIVEGLSKGDRIDDLKVFVRD